MSDDRTCGCDVVGALNYVDLDIDIDADEIDLVLDDPEDIDAIIARRAMIASLTVTRGRA